MTGTRKTEVAKMIFTPVPTAITLAPAATTMSNAFTATAAVLIPPGVPGSSVAPQIEQLQGPNFITLKYLLPRQTRVDDEVEFYLIDSNGTAILIRTYKLTDYDIFWALCRYEGLFIRGEILATDLTNLGITSGTWDFICVHYSRPTPTLPPPAPPSPQTPLRVVASSGTQTYVVT